MTAVPRRRISRFAFRLLPLLVALFEVHAPGQATPRFEVATIRLDPDCSGGTREQQSPGRFGVLCASVRDVIRVAYGDVEGQGRLPDVLGGPHWMDSERYDIVATAPENPGLDQMYGPMTRTLLEDRFHLKLHDEVRNLPVYRLTVLKQAARLKPTPEGSCVTVDLKTILQSSAPANYCGRLSVTNGATITFDGHGVTIAQFIARGLRKLDRPVIDETGLKGRFDIHLEFATMDSLDAGDAPSVFTAIQEQLGLKLSVGTGPVEVHVIDHVERPSEN